MPKPFRLLLPLVAVAALAFPAAASAWHNAFPKTPNITTLGESARPGGFTVPAGQLPNPNSDIAFWRNFVFQGNYPGFRILDVSNPMSPRVVSEVTCGRDQGDVTISPDGNILIRSQDSPRILPGNNQANACEVGRTATAGECGEGLAAGTCTTQLGWEGLQIFDVSNKAAPRFIGAVFTDFGSHTHTQYHDRANNRLIIYVSRAGAREGAQGTGAYQPPPATQNPYGGQNWPSTNGCITAVEVPLANPAGARVVNRCIVAGRAPVTVSAGGCHDVAVYEGIRRMFGACRPNHTLWDTTDPVNPQILHEMTFPGTRTPHSATFSWDGKLLLAGWEPGGGGQAECEANDPPEEKSVMIFSAATGALVGTWTLPRPQGSTENCTIHNYNVVPYIDRHILVQGSYQSGWSFVDFTSPTAPRELGYVDPPPLSATELQLGGDWSTHWYNGLVYESDITRGLAIYDVNEPWWENAVELPFLNPQTQTEALRCTISVRGGALRAQRRGSLTAVVRVNGDAVRGVPVRFNGAGIDRTVRTNANGTVATSVRAQRGGTLRIGVPTQLNMPACTTSRRVAAAPRRPGGGGQLPGLTGRRA